MLPFSRPQSIAILSRTPSTLNTLLSGLPDEWVKANTGPDTWSAFDVVGHLIHGERTDWLQRINIILNNEPEEARFAPFDRFAQFRESQGKTIDMLLAEFEDLRRENLQLFEELPITENLDRTGIHPSLGTVTLRHLLSTWVAHDLTHTAQISKVLAMQYRGEMGPWLQFFNTLQ